MNRSLILIVLFSFIVGGCDYREREAQLKQKETALNEKEQQLILKEKSLELREQDLLKREQALDSTLRKDTTHKIDSALIGNWGVEMICTEATCPGSAVGDKKIETWQISYTGTDLIAKAFVNNQLARTYSGFYTGNTVELTQNRNATDGKAEASMIVRLTIRDATHLEGQREIVRENQCKVIYALQMEKQ
jgi:hypothetical protein